MSDFLGNLLARSVQIPTGVRPRLATRFEPPTMATAEIETSTRPRPPAEAPEERFPAPSNQPGPDLDEPLRAPPLPASARMEALETRVTTRPAALNQPPAPAPAQPSAPSPVETAKPALHSSPAPLLSPAGPLIQRADSGREPPFPLPAAQQAGEREQQPQMGPPQTRREIFSERVILTREAAGGNPPAGILWGLADDPAGEETAPPAGRSTEPTSPPPNALETIRPTRASPPVRAISQAAGPDTPSMAAALPAGPTIEVTIGRIEVRATLPPAQAARERKPHAALSLEEYMRQRNGGKG